MLSRMFTNVILRRRTAPHSDAGAQRMTVHMVPCWPWMKWRGSIPFLPLFVSIR